MFEVVKNKKQGLCCAYRCSNAKGEKDRFCPKHRKRYDKHNNPVSYHFNILRSNAKRRGKDFSLTLDEFKEFCTKTDYLDLKGKNKKSASIDRVDSSRGYHADNIQVLSLSANSSKRWVDEKCPF